MNPHPYDVMELPNGGRILLTPCPGTKGADITSSVTQLHNAETRVLITLMPNEEMKHFEAESLPELCKQHAIRWIHLPIEDNSSPKDEFEEVWLQHREHLHQILSKGGTVAIHCKGGSGRTGLMAAILLIERGAKLEEAISHVKALRPRAFKAPAHQKYIHQLASGLQKTVFK